MNNKTFTKDDLKSGYLVKFRFGGLRLVTRVGQFTKVLVNPETGEWNYLSNWGDDLKIHRSSKRSHVEFPAQCFGDDYDVMEVYGLINKTSEYGLCFRANLADTSHLCNRPLLWERKEPVKMTVAEICAKLGYEVEIVSGGGKNEAKV